MEALSSGRRLSRYLCGIGGCLLIGGLLLPGNLQQTR